MVWLVGLPKSAREIKGNEVFKRTKVLNNTLKYVFWALCHFVPRRNKSIESDFGAVFLPPSATRLHRVQMRDHIYKKTISKQL